MTREEFNEQSLIDRIENRINAEYRKHKNLDWAKIAAIKIAHEILSTYGPSLPPAEGAEEIFQKHRNEPYGIFRAMEEYATLHAQRLAEKMKDANQFILDIARVLGIETDGVGFDELTLSIDDFKKAAEKMVEKGERDNHVEQLREFHTAFGLPQRDKPTIMPIGEFKSRQSLLEEEVEELNTAYENGDIIEVADAITDCLYVLIGTALQFGIADVLDECFDEVHKSNMSKLGSDGKPIVREDGKVMKGPNFSRPELYRILKPLRHE